MTLIQWKDEEHSVGIKAMDDQHKVLIGLINALDQNKWNPDKEFVEKVINTLKEYIQTHFAEEEKVMKKMKFPHFDIHMTQHKDFIERIESFHHRFSNSSEQNAQVITDLLVYLEDWLIKHIKHQDTKYYEWLLE